jgi:tryptophanyl-tRNA synthetase
MHTSYGNAIYLRDTPEETTRKVMSMYTDPTRIHPDDPGHVEGNPVFAYQDVFNPDKAGVDELKERYRQGKVGDVEVKRLLAIALNDYLAPIRARREELIKHPSDLVDLLATGTRQAAPVAEATLSEVISKMGLPAIQ